MTEPRTVYTNTNTQPDELVFLPIIAPTPCTLCGQTRAYRTVVTVTTHDGATVSVCKVCRNGIDNAFMRMWL